MKTFKHIILNTFLAVGSILLSFLFLELVLRLFFSPHYNAGKYLEYDSQLGWINKPNVDMDVAIGDKIYFNVKHNSKGLRESVHFDYSKKGKKRILFMGDSFLWGFGVEEHERFTELLSSKIEGHAEVINFGVPGYSTDQEYLLFAKEAIKYQPDLTILCFLSTNDILGNMREIMYKKPKPFFKMEESDGSLILKNVPVPRRNITSSIRFPFKRFLKQNSLMYKFFRRKSQLLEKIHSKDGIKEQTLDQFSVFDKRLPEQFGQGWAITEKILAAFKEQCHSIDSKFMVIIFPREDQLSKAEWASTMEYYGLTDNNYARNLPDSLLSNIGKNKDIRIFSLLRVFEKELVKGQKLYFDHDGHWNKLGHYLAFESIYRIINANFSKIIRESI